MGREKGVVAGDQLVKQYFTDNNFGLCFAGRLNEVRL